MELFMAVIESKNLLLFGVWGTMYTVAHISLKPPYTAFVYLHIIYG